MNERFLSGVGVEQSGQIKIGVVRLEDLLGGQKLTFDLCELLDTCDEDEGKNKSGFRSYLKGGDLNG